MMYIQSRKQYLFSKIYESSFQVLLFALVLLLMGQSGQFSGLPLGLHIGMLILLPVLVTAWLVVFNSGRSKIVENGFSIDGDGLTVISFGETKRLGWNEYEGFKVSRLPPNRVLIRSKNSGNNIEFGYFRFSTSQRRVLFDELKSRRL